MKTLFFCLVWLFCQPVFAAEEQKDTFDDGANAFVAGNYDEAERILKLHAKEQPSAVYLLRLIKALRKEKKIDTPSYPAFLERLYKGEIDMLDRLGIIPRRNADLSGIAGSMYLNTLIGNAKRGDIAAKYNLALLYQEGIGVPRNFKTAAENFKAAAEAEHLNALNSIGLYTRFGIGTKADEKQAEKYFKQAVLLNNPYAFYNLAQYYLDKKDYIQAFILADVGRNHLDKNVHRKVVNRFLETAKKAQKKLSPLQTAYLTRFLPFWLSGVLTKDDLNGRIYPKKLPLPPVDMVRETTFFFPLKRDAFDGKYKKFFPFMPAWVPFDIEQPSNPALAGKKPPAPFPESDEAIRALYFRVANPATIHLTLDKPESAIPVMTGDVFEIIVYSKLHETASTLKGAHKYIDNTDYTIVLESADNALITDYKPVLTPLSIETRHTETWLSQVFEAKKPGIARIRFVPTVENGFAHTLTVQISDGKLPQ